MRILTVGDGDLTFSLSISEWFWHLKEAAEGKKKRKKQVPPLKLVATSYDSLEELQSMYQPCFDHTHKCLLRNGSEIHCNVDATQLIKDKERLDGKDEKFDRIIWNFPHGGFPEGEEDHHGPGFEWTDSFLKRHSSLVRAFIEESKQFLRPDGMVIITNKSIEPFSLWDIPAMGEELGYELAFKEPFSIDNYPGY